MAQNNPNVVNIANIADNPPPAPGVEGPIGFVQPEAEIVAERAQNAQRDQAEATRKRPRFEVVTRRENPNIQADPTVEALILSAAYAFGIPREIRYTAPSYYIPNAAVLMFFIRHMDIAMASTKHWIGNCLFWTPIHTLIYVSMLYYIQIMRAMDCAGTIRTGSELSTLLHSIKLHYRFDNLWVPGPLVQFFKSISCFLPFEDNSFGVVTPRLPETPGWSRENTRYGFLPPHNLMMPNIPALFSRLSNICAAARRENATDATFQNDVDGPNHMSRLFGRPLTNDGIDRGIASSPGINCATSGSLKLWQNAAARISGIAHYPPLNQAETEVTNTWTSYFGLPTQTNWFGSIASVMAKYCQHWKGSCYLSECHPNKSAAGGIVVTADADSHMFNPPEWVAPSGNHGGTAHGQTDQAGHYTLHTDRTLTVSAETAIKDIPDAMYQAAITYAVNMLPPDAGNALRRGHFWRIRPPCSCPGRYLYPSRDHDLYLLRPPQRHSDRPHPLASTNAC